MATPSAVNGVKVNDVTASALSPRLSEGIKAVAEERCECADEARDEDLRRDRGHDGARAAEEQLAG